MKSFDLVLKKFEIENNYLVLYLFYFFESFSQNNK